MPTPFSASFLAPLFAFAIALSLVLALILVVPAPAALRAAPAGDAAGRLVLAFGDSLTAGYQLPPEESFPARLQAELRRQGVAVTVRNAGVSGDTTAQGLARLSWVLQGLPKKPDLVLVALGANDMLRGLPPQQAEANLGRILADLRQKKIPVLLIGMVAAPNMGKEYGRSFNAIYEKLAREYKVPLYPFFLQGVAGNRTLQLLDGMHPNGRGTSLMARNLAPDVLRALGARPPAASAKERR